MRRIIMTGVLLSILMATALVSFMGCGAGVEGGAIALSEKERVASPDVAVTDLTDLVEGNSAFAFDLYQALSEEDGNLFYSPYSISLALAMTYAGARGETGQQMADTLHFILPQDRLHTAFNGLDLELASRGEGAEGKDVRFLHGFLLQA